MIPPPHREFLKADARIQKLFLRALDDSFDHPNLRPSADEWCRALSSDPDIAIDRRLPTKRLECFTPEYSQRIPPSPLTLENFDPPRYLRFSLVGGFFAKVRQSFGQSEKNDLKLRVIAAQK